MTQPFRVLAAPGVVAQPLMPAEAVSLCSRPAWFTE